MILDKQKFDHERLDFNLFSIEDRAWAAGFIDGDGAISFYMRPDRETEFFIKVFAVNTNIEPLRKLQMMFGGSINQMNRERDDRNWKASWTWGVSHRRAERVILAIWPFLVCKHEQAMEAIKARTLVSGDRKRRSPETLAALRATEARFRELNRKGISHGSTH